MSYQYLTQYNSPNYTSYTATPGAYGMARKIEGITIHWWGDPAQNPQFQNIVNYLCRANGNTSAHYVATGTNRQVACIVSPDDTAWHAGTAWGNARTIGIECDPRGRAEDFDVVAELIADIRSAYGDVPLYLHSYFVSTACPSIYRDRIDYLDQLSYTKFSASEWGKGGNKVQTPPPTPTPVPETPKPTPVTLVETETFTPVKSFVITKPTTLVNIPDGTKYNNTGYNVNQVIETVAEKLTYSNGQSFVRTVYARDKAKKMYGFNVESLKEVVNEKPAPEQTTPSPTTGQPDSGKPIVDKDDYEETKAKVNYIWEFLKKLFSGFGAK